MKRAASDKKIGSESKRARLSEGSKHDVEKYELDLNRFPDKLRSLLDTKASPIGLRWSPEGDAILIHKRSFCDDLLIPHFRGNKWPSVTRNLNRWGFRRVPEEREPEGMLGFCHTLFLKSSPWLLKSMKKEVYVKMPKKEDEDNSSIADDSFDEEKEPRKKPSKEKKTRKVHRNKNKRRERQADEPHDNSEPNAQTPSALPSTQYLSHPTVLAGRSSLSSSASRAADLRSPTTSLQHEPNLYRTTLDATSTTLRDNLRLNHLSNEQLLQLVMAHERLLQQQSSPIPSLMRNSTIDHLLLSATTHLPLLQQQHRYATLGLLFDSDSSTPTTTRSSSLLKGLARFHSGTSFK